MLSNEQHRTIHMYQAFTCTCVQVNVDDTTVHLQDSNRVLAPISLKPTTTNFTQGRAAQNHDNKATEPNGAKPIIQCVCYTPIKGHSDTFFLPNLAYYFITVST